MNEDSRFAYFRLPNGTTFHLPRSVLDLAAAPARLQVDSLITLEALAASILGVPDVDFLKWGDSLSEASNELESKMARSQAPVLGESYGDSDIDRIMEVTSEIEGYCFSSISYDPVGGVWNVTVTHGTVDCGGSTYGGCETSLTTAVNSTMRAIAGALESGKLKKRPPAPPFQKPLEIWGYPLGSRVWIDTVHGWRLGKLDVEPVYSYKEEPCRAVVFVDSYSSGVAVVPVTRRHVIPALCRACGEPQFWTPAGYSCKNGHGEAPPLPHDQTSIQ
jgi:hypothetical protein